ncbi:AMP-binding protein [Thiorhodovibrio litoralis]|uniref:AMP-binding protein n=3 Tax=Thiorhodovibrio TaxID=61593 RepID=UPI002B2630EC|nr:AMP-binding protein [Thiorhodovibrio litoralis]WPL12591.1 2-succinylbenzoate--CoA ligase [Thiorhodovibrio litoralis]
MTSVETFQTLARPVAVLISPDGEISGDELLTRSHARAAELRRQGLQYGDLVICPVDAASPSLTLMQAALALNNAALLPVPAGLTPTDERNLATQTGANWMWEPADRPRTGSGCNPGGGQLRALGPSADSSRGEDVARHGSLALVVQTSGSSGGRKAAMLSAQALYASCERINQRLGLAANDLWLCALPRQHIGGLAIGYRCALAGAGMLLHPGFDAGRVAADLWRHPVTHLSLVPAMLARLLDQCPRPPQWLRVLLIGGQALDSRLAQRALAAGWPLHLGYGMTETCSFIASRKLADLDEAGDGREEGARGEGGLEPLPDVQLEAPACASGESPSPLRLRAPMLMMGYANPRRRPRLGLDADGWLRTADLACLSDTSGLRVLGRADDQLVIGGVNVQPGMIEAQISQCADVSRCVLVGLPEPVWGHVLVAFYQGAISAAALDAWCREHLSSPRRPRLFLPMRDWPLLASGKDNRARLREIAADAWCSRSESSR